MNRKFRCALFILLCLVQTTVLFARDVTEESVGTENSWQESMDLEGKKSGKYNVLVTAEDIAGNVTVAGPFNLWVDPESDLPVAGITNPTLNMFVPGNLNIVGTCIDDDGVDHVTLILDGDKDHPVYAEGREFWSYYLDTVNLKEGEHTIEVYGTDVNGLDGHISKLTWNLNRKNPETVVTSPGMGTLVSGKINLTGYVKDGNGIKSLEYSLDGGKHYAPVALKQQKLSEVEADGTKVHYTFSIGVDTKQFPDGPGTCWLKGTDSAGSISYYSFLYFIDNTPPDITIVSPTRDDVCNGVFNVTGYAKDTNGMVSLKWQWGNESGDFELIAGNPYWTKQVSSIGNSAKSQKFTVTGVDVMGNVVTKSIDIKLNQELDKPVVTITAPQEGVEIEGKEGALYLRGIATDDDGVSKVYYRVDGGEEVMLECEGVFFAKIPQVLSTGVHTIRAYAVDRYGVRGDTVTRTFTSNGVAPVFADAVVKNAKGSKAYSHGMEINPETSSVLEVPVSTTSGLASLSYEITWGRNGSITGETALKGGEKSASIQVPLYGEEFPWGILNLTVKAKDTFGRETKYTTFLNIKNLTHGDYSNPGVYFTDSIVSEDGSILLQSGRTVSGFFSGARAASVQTVPQLRAVTASLNGNSIVLSSTAETDNFVVRVTTAAGDVYDSKPLKFISKETAPVLTLDNNSIETGVPVDFSTATSVTVNGRVTGSGDYTVKYRILAAQANIVNGAVKSSAVLPVPSLDEAEVVETNRRGEFSLTFRPSDFVDGVSVVEFVAQSAGGLQTAKAIVVNNVPAKRVKMSDDEVIPPSDTPKVYWLRGIDYYGICVYQGNVDKNFMYVKDETLRADVGKLTFTVSATDVDKPAAVSASITASKRGKLSSYFESADGKSFVSGMNVALEGSAVKEDGHVIKAVTTSTAAVVRADYTITSKDAFGSDFVQKGVVTVDTIEEAARYGLTVPLFGLPAGTAKVSVHVVDATGAEESFSSSINVVRTHSQVNETESVYVMPYGNTVYNTSDARYVFEEGSGLMAFVNMPGEITGSVRGATGLTAVTSGKVVIVTADRDGSYAGFTVRGASDKGGVLNSSAINVLADTVAPTIALDSPSNASWQQNSVYVYGTATDSSGLRSMAYSIGEVGEKAEDGSVKELAWTPIQFTRSGVFEFRINVSGYEDGEIPLNIRAEDITGKIGYNRLVLHKDTKAPEVTVIVPEPGAKVNGENLIVFDVKDNGVVTTYNYTSAGRGIVHNWNAWSADALTGTDKTTQRSLYEASPNAFVGTDENPINNAMNWTFRDKAGNATTLNKYEFAVESESDLPVIEIHMPEENSVITTDFTISGIVYDDDGTCRVYYKMDGGSYNLISSDYSSSYKINVPLSAMTDNEHTVTVVAEDIHGTRGKEVSRKFRISLEEPKGAVSAPSFVDTVKDTITIRGIATDRNGIQKVLVSLDNGATFNEAVGKENWSYTFDTHVLQDGTHVVFIKIYDNYGITGLYSSLVNIDNTAPELSLELPLDDSVITKTVFFSGQTTDNIGLTSLYITIRSFDSSVRIPASLAKVELDPDEIITHQLDLSGLQNGFYNVELTGTDAANNITRVSRNIQLNKNTPRSKVGVLYPLNGEHVQSVFNIYGTATSEEAIVKTELLVDGKPVLGAEETQLTAPGYFKFTVRGEVKQPDTRVKKEDGTVEIIPGASFELSEGMHKYTVVITTESGEKIRSPEQTFIYSKYGPWVTLDNFTYGDFATERPLLKGNAGYVVNPEELASLRDRDLPSETRTAIEGKKVKQVSVSFDNGRTYQPVAGEGRGAWQYRVEDADFAAGYHFMLVKAEMVNGECATTRVIIQIDHTAPTIRLISPGEGGHYNQELTFEGLTSDDIGLKDVTISLRKGDKNSYGVPSFIQGLYVDGNVWGATLWSAGIGLTAFDGAVKIQAQYGQMTPEQYEWLKNFFGSDNPGYRFGGHAPGVKIIAQIADIPFAYFWGHDWDWLSATIAVGANFTWFSDSGAVDPNDPTKPVSQMLSAALVQIEFPKMTFAKNPAFKTWAFYLEPQVWFIPSDVASDLVKNYVFTVSGGFRVNIF